MHRHTLSLRSRLTAGFAAGLVALLFAWPAAAATWPETWRSETGAADPGKLMNTISDRGVAYISIPSEAAVGENSPFIGVSSPRGSTLCVDTDVATLAAGGALVIDIYWNVGADNTAAASVIIGTLSSGTSCLFDIPKGRINVEVTTEASTTLGEIRLQGNGS